MRHRKKTIKLGRTSEHRDALLASLVCNLITYKRITTTVAKAKAARPFAEKMVTLAKGGTLADRRRAISRLRRKDCVAALFSSVAPAFADRFGGYTRIVRIGRRPSDSSEMAILEWVNYVPTPPKKRRKKGEKEAGGPDSGGEPAKGKAKPAEKAEEEEKSSKKKAPARKSRKGKEEVAAE
jgi:large subunit ribosomal protein L17